MKLSTRCLPLLVCAAAGCANQGGTNQGTMPSKMDVPVRSYTFTYEVMVPAQPDAKEIDVWVPVALQDPGVQEVTDLDVQAPAGYEITTEGEYGNRMIHCRVPGSASPIKIGWTAKVTRHGDVGQGMLATKARYLAADQLVPNDGKARDMAVQLGVTDTGMSVHDRAKRIYDDVLDNMAYDKSGVGWGQGSFEHAITVCKGNCTDFHSRFIGVGRAAGIPVRFTMGIPMKPTKVGEYNSYHCWAHYYDGSHWQPVDISEADKVAATDPARAQWYFRHLDTNRISLTFGRDITLAPPQQGAKLNYFVFPYAEADGKAMKMSKDTDWKFRWEDV